MRDKQSIKDDIVQRLATVIDPELHIDIVNLGLVYTIDLDNDGICLIEMTLTTMGMQPFLLYKIGRAHV